MREQTAFTRSASLTKARPLALGASHAAMPPVPSDDATHRLTWWRCDT